MVCQVSDMLAIINRWQMVRCVWHGVHPILVSYLNWWPGRCCGGAGCPRLRWMMMGDGVVVIAVECEEIDSVGKC